MAQTDRSTADIERLDLLDRQAGVTLRELEGMDPRLRAQTAAEAARQLIFRSGATPDEAGQWYDNRAPAPGDTETPSWATIERPAALTRREGQFPVV